VYQVVAHSNSQLLPHAIAVLPQSLVVLSQSLGITLHARTRHMQALLIDSTPAVCARQRAAESAVARGSCIAALPAVSRSDAMRATVYSRRVSESVWRLCRALTSSKSACSFSLACMHAAESSSTHALTHECHVVHRAQHREHSRSYTYRCEVRSLSKRSLALLLRHAQSQTQARQTRTC
jgi:hypothetical protein